MDNEAPSVPVTRFEESLSETIIRFPVRYMTRLPIQNRSFLLIDYCVRRELDQTLLERLPTHIRLQLPPAHALVALGSNCSFRRGASPCSWSSTFSPSSFMSSTAFSKMLTNSAMGCPGRLWSFLQKNFSTCPFFVASSMPMALSSRGHSLTSASVCTR